MSRVEEGRSIVKRGTVILTDRNGTPLGEDKREIERDALRPPSRCYAPG